MTAVVDRTTPARAWSGAMGWAALAVVLVQVVWRAAYLGGSFWNQDDYFFLLRAADQGLTWEYLFAETAGHVNPGQQFVVWLQHTVDPMGWWFAATTVLFFQTASTVALWHLLTKLLPGRWARVPILAFFALTPLTLASTLWWAAMLALWPTLLFSVLSAVFLLRWLRRERFGVLNAVACVVGYLAAFAFHERAVLLPITLGALAVLETRSTGVWRPVRDGLTSARWLWVTIVVITTALLVAYRLGTELENSGADLGTRAELSWWYVGRTLLPGLFGGPWSLEVVGGAVVPGFVGVVGGLVGLLVVVLLARTFGGRRTAWAAAYLVLFVLANLVLLLVARSGQGAVIALDPRYAADIPLAAAIAVAAALRDDGWDRLRTRLPRPHVLALASTVGYVASAAITTTQLAPELQNSEDRTYFENVRAALRAEPSMVLVDELVPPDILLPLYGDDSRASRVLSRLPERPRFDLPSEQLRILDEQGVPRVVSLLDPVVMRPGPVEGCGYAVSRSRSIPLDGAVGMPGGRVVLRVDYFTNLASTGTLTLDGRRIDVGFAPGPHRLEAVLQLDEDSTADSLAVRLDDAGGSAVCITGVEVGVPIRPY